jgi:isopentenyl diphosphate isomerase/L-lactate dehydrogenase-like FMN-dependent dehydrogenase
MVGAFPLNAGEKFMTNEALDGGLKVERAVSLDDFRVRAKAKLPPEVFAYIDSGACDEITKQLNRRDLDGIRLLPRSLRDVGELTMSPSFLGQSFSAPIGFSPTALHKLVDPEGELATAAVAKQYDIPCILSSMSSYSLEEIIKATGSTKLWLQTYIFKDRDLTLDLTKRAERAGYAALVLTTGVPVVGNRYRSRLNPMRLPADVRAANFERSDRSENDNPIHAIEGAALDPTVTWRDVRWLIDNTRLPVVLKGIMNPRDVEPAIDMGIAGIIVSNHGGRQLDTTESTAKALPMVASAVAGRIPVLVDIGIRRGTDILKTVALGADGVLMGRPVLWALAAGGRRGLEEAVSLVLEEFQTAMRLSGYSSVAELRSESELVLRTGW